MNVLDKEPALTVSAAVAAVLGVLLAYRLVTTEQAAAWGPLLVMLGGLVIRSGVFSRNTIRQAGLNPAEVDRRAADPRVTPYTEPQDAP